MAIVSVRQLVKVFVFDNMSVFIKATLSFHGVIISRELAEVCHPNWGI